MKTIGELIKIPINKGRKCSECGREYVPKEYKNIGIVYVPGCTCLKKKQIQEEKRKQRIYNYALLKQRLKDADFPYDTLGKRLKTRTCENIETAKERALADLPNALNTELVTLIKSIIKSPASLVSAATREGLYFVGPVGNA